MIEALLMAMCFAAQQTPVSPCDGINDESFAAMRQIAEAHFAHGESKGAAFRAIRAWMKEQSPPIDLTADQKHCWTRELGRDFDQRERQHWLEQKQRDLEAHARMIESLTNDELRWIAFYQAAYARSLAQAEEALKTCRNGGISSQMASGSARGTGGSTFTGRFALRPLSEFRSPKGNSHRGLRDDACKKLASRVTALREFKPPWMYTIGNASVEVGQAGSLLPCRVISVSDESNALLRIDRASSILGIDAKIWITGVDTTRLVDDQLLTLPGYFVVSGTQSYESNSGTRTVPRLTPINVDPHKLAKLYGEIDAAEILRRRDQSLP